MTDDLAAIGTLLQTEPPLSGLVLITSALRVMWNPGPRSAPRYTGQPCGGRTRWRGQGGLGPCFLGLAGEASSDRHAT